jgi:hypothetical protein
LNEPNTQGAPFDKLWATLGYGVEPLRGIRPVFAILLREAVFVVVKRIR